MPASERCPCLIQQRLIELVLFLPVGDRQQQRQEEMRREGAVLDALHVEGHELTVCCLRTATMRAGAITQHIQIYDQLMRMNTGGLGSITLGQPRSPKSAADGNLVPGLWGRSYRPAWATSSAARRWSAGRPLFRGLHIRHETARDTNSSPGPRSRSSIPAEATGAET